jgi:hypothetical protein
MDILPSKAKDLAWTHPCATNHDCSVAPRLRTFGYVLLPLGIGQNSITLAFPLAKVIFAGRSSLPHS